MKYYDEQQIKQINILSLAFVGDAVHSLFVKTKLCELGFEKVGNLQKETAKRVKAKTQSLVLDNIFDMLNEDEKYIVNRARNAKTNNIAKNSCLIEYKKSTSFEALIGYLYLTNNQIRLYEILEISFSAVNEK